MRIFLVGFMGAGKSAIGRKLAERLGYRFVDTDKLIEADVGLSISQIFAEKGEPWFRKKETETLFAFSHYQNLVISTGGGMVATEGNWEKVKALGPSVFLDADFEDIKERVARKNTRPLLQTDDPTQTLIELYQKRRPIYEQADIQVQTKGLSKQKIVTEIIRAL